MKAIVLALILTLVLPIYAGGTRSIHEAVKEGYIQLKCTSTGLMNGKSVRLHIDILKGGIFKMTLPKGTVFKTIDEGMQDMLIIQDQDILVSNEKKDYEVEGFCCQARNSVPSENAGFTLAMHPNKGIQTLAEFLADKKIDTHLMQDAIWNVCDREIPSGLFDSNNSQVDALRKLVCSINQVPEPWYEKKSRVEMDEARNVHRLPVSVEAKLDYEVTSPGGKLNYQVMDKNGTVIRNYESKISLHQKGEYQMGFKLTVSGWEEGAYTLILRIDEKVLKTYPFEV